MDRDEDHPRGPVCLHIGAHPDDELLGAPASLMALRDAGWEVIVLVCSLGRVDDRRRRHQDLERACAAVGFDLRVLRPELRLGRDDDAGSISALTEHLPAVVNEIKPDLIVAPSPHDGHHAHEYVGRAALEVARMCGVRQVGLWGIWRMLDLPTHVTPFGEPRFVEIIQAVSGHDGEVGAGDYRNLTVGRAIATRALAPERVLGYGTRDLSELPYAEETTWMLLHDDRWHLAVPGVFDPTSVERMRVGEEAEWWIARSSLRQERVARAALAV